MCGDSRRFWRREVKALYSRPRYHDPDDRLPSRDGDTTMRAIIRYRFISVVVELAILELPLRTESLAI